MVLFRRMDETEFGDYASYFIRDYTEEIAENFNISYDAAAELAKRELASDLPEGIRTNGQYLFCIIRQVTGVSDHIGYIWYNRKAKADQIFICDFHILPIYQGQGLGKQAIANLDTHLSDLGVGQIRLRVAIKNKIALHVYESSGFSVTGINMFKEIKPYPS